MLGVCVSPLLRINDTGVSKYCAVSRPKLLSLGADVKTPAVSACHAADPGSIPSGGISHHVRAQCTGCNVEHDRQLHIRTMLNREKCFCSVVLWFCNQWCKLYMRVALGVSSQPDIAQLAEHLTVDLCSDQMVPGSIPLSGFGHRSNIDL